MTPRPRTYQGPAPRPTSDHLYQRFEETTTVTGTLVQVRQWSVEMLIEGQMVRVPKTQIQEGQQRLVTEATRGQPLTLVVSTWWWEHR